MDTSRIVHSNEECGTKYRGGVWDLAPCGGGKLSLHFWFSSMHTHSIGAFFDRTMAEHFDMPCTWATEDDFINGNYVLPEEFFG